jgi:hypothetical protein
MGAVATLVVLINFASAPAAPSTQDLMRGAMGAIADWVFLPSLTLTLVAGLLAIAANRAFHNAGWAWMKAATGILIFAGGLHAVAPIQEEARRSAAADSVRTERAAISDSRVGEQGTLWVLLAVTTANVALGVWRPRLGRRGARVPLG